MFSFVVIEKNPKNVHDLTTSLLKNTKVELKLAEIDLSLLMCMLLYPSAILLTLVHVRFRECRKLSVSQVHNKLLHHLLAETIGDR